jgi:hypothetical protein
MPRVVEGQTGKIIGVFLTTGMIKRLRHHAIETDQTLRSVITTALEATLPRDNRVGESLLRSGKRASK